MVQTKLGGLNRGGKQVETGEGIQLERTSLRQSGVCVSVNTVKHKCVCVRDRSPPGQGPVPTLLAPVKGVFPCLFRSGLARARDAFGSSR